MSDEADPPRDENAPQTTYVVLQRDTDGGGIAVGRWEEVLDSAINARSANEAIRRAHASKALAPGTYVAVPARSWRPVTVKAVQTTVLKLEDAK